MSDEETFGITVAQFLHLKRGMRDAPPTDGEVADAAVRRLIEVDATPNDAAPDGLGALIDWLGCAEKNTPAELRESARVSVSSNDGFAYWSVTYSRPETDDEWSARRKEIERRVALHAPYVEARQREDYERLKAKFG